MSDIYKTVTYLNGPFGPAAAATCGQIKTRFAHACQRFSTRPVDNCLPLSAEMTTNRTQQGVTRP